MIKVIHDQKSKEKIVCVFDEKISRIVVCIWTYVSDFIVIFVQNSNVLEEPLFSI